MKALILAAGFGSRLGELTLTTPKPLIQVKNQPILGFCLDQLANSGVNEVVVNTHFLASQVENYLKSYKSHLKILSSYEDKLLGTAGTLKKHFDFLATDDFVVMHADNYFVDPLINFLQAHKFRSVGVYGTLGTFETRDPRNCGVLELNRDGTILDFHEKVENPPSRIANAAIYAFTPQIKEALFDLDQDNSDISKHLIPKIMQGLYTDHFDGLFVDIGTPEGLEIANSYK